MIRLDATNRSLEVILAAAITTNQLNCTASYSDKTAIAYTGGSAYTNTNSAVAVTLVAAPSASTVRDIDMVNIYNADTVSARVTVRVNDNTTMRVLGVFTLNSQDTLRYTHASGWEVINSSGAQKVVLSAAASGLTCYLLPSLADGWRSIYRAGFDWWSRNQQWGGPFGFELVDAATGTMYKGEAATGYINQNGQSSVGSTTGAGWSRFQGFKVPETQTVANVWVRLAKTGNPTDNIVAYIYSDTGGVPNALVTNGTATAISGNTITSDANGQCYRFNFATPPSLTGGTQYHLVLIRSGAADGSNYYNPFWDTSKSAMIYPFGQPGYGTNVPVWTAQTDRSFCFLVELSATAQILQTSGIYDGKLAFGGSGASGTLSMSRGLCNSVPLREHIPDPTEFTVWIAGTALTKDATILDIGYGEDHDRIVLRSNITTGYGQVDVYENDGQTGSAAKTTVTATATDLSSGNHYIGVYVRAKNDGSDRIDLYIDGTTYSSATNLSLSFDTLLRELGTMWVGGGFAVAVTDTLKTTMSALPSAAGTPWTFTGTGTEANCFSVSGNVLYQNKNGFGSTDTAYYKRSTLSLSNTNGWSVRCLNQIISSGNTASSATVSVEVNDSAKRFFLGRQEYFTQGFKGSWMTPIQVDNKSRPNTLHCLGKGSDFITFHNRRLLEDGTGQLTNASVNNFVSFGDDNTTAGENADAQWKYVAYYNTAWNPPQFTSGSISELAIWQGNMKALWPLLYNSGSPVSAKQLLGIPNNYLDKSAKIPAIEKTGITSSPTSSTSPPGVLLAECEAFVIGSEIRMDFDAQIQAVGAAPCDIGFVSVWDGKPATSTGGGPPNGYTGEYVADNNGRHHSTHGTYWGYLGLHKVSINLWTNGASCTSGGVIRPFTLKGSV